MKNLSKILSLSVLGVALTLAACKSDNAQQASNTAVPNDAASQVENQTPDYATLYLVNNPNNDYFTTLPQLLAKIKIANDLGKGNLEAATQALNAETDFLLLLAGVKQDSKDYREVKKQQQWFVNNLVNYNVANPVATPESIKGAIVNDILAINAGEIILFLNGSDYSNSSVKDIERDLKDLIDNKKSEIRKDVARTFAQKFNITDKAAIDKIEDYAEKAADHVEDYLKVFLDENDTVKTITDVNRAQTIYVGTILNSLAIYEEFVINVAKVDIAQRVTVYKALRDFYNDNIATLNIDRLNGVAPNQNPTSSVAPVKPTTTVKIAFLKL